MSKTKMTFNFQDGTKTKIVEKIIPPVLGSVSKYTKTRRIMFIFC